MNNDSKFPQKAAYFCLAAPFLGDIVLSITKESIHKSPSSEIIVFVILIALLLAGFGLGIFSLLNSNGIKKIFITALIGIVLNLITTYIAYAAYENNKKAKNYFEINFEYKKADNTTHAETILGSSPRAFDVNNIMGHLVKGIRTSCPDCSITKSDQIKTVPPEFDGIFELKPIKYTYIYMDMTNEPHIKLRNIYPKRNPQPNCKDTDMIEKVNNQSNAAKNNANIACVEALK